MMLPAQFLKRFRHGRIGVFRKENIPHAVCPHSFFQLFGSHDQIHFAQVGQTPALGYSTIFFHIHTNLYYTQISEKVNKKIRNIFAIMLSFRIFFNTFYVTVLLSSYSGYLSSVQKFRRKEPPSKRMTAHFFI